MSRRRLGLFDHQPMEVHKIRWPT